MSIPKERAKFRNSTNGRYLKGLFYETTLADKSSVLYTLKDWDHEGYPSLYRLYMEMDDLTEFEFSRAHLDGWEHWEMLCNCEWFKPYVERWRKELTLKTQARALNALKAEAESSSKNAFAANKLLLERGWVPKEDSKGRGRPSKDEVRKAADDIAKHNSRLEEDTKRLEIN